MSQELIAECETKIQALLAEYGCTLVYEEVRANGQITGFQIKVVPLEAE